jgi:hypothetical protein
MGHRRALIALSVLLASCNRMPAPSTKTAGTESTYGWVTIFDRQEGMSYKGAAWWSLEDTDKVRFKITTKVPVYVGVIPRQVQKSEVPSLDLSGMECSDSGTTDAERECTLPNRQSTLLIRDIQTPDGGVIHRTHLMNVKIEIWGCTNCPRKPSTRGR